MVNSMKRLALVAATGIALGGPPPGAQPAAPASTDWPAVAGDLGAMKYSPADQITPANVSKLSQARTYQAGGPAPIVITNLMYFAAGPNIVALNADSGTEAWKFA